MNSTVINNLGSTGSWNVIATNNGKHFKLFRSLSMKLLILLFFKHGMAGGLENNLSCITGLKKQSDIHVIFSVHSLSKDTFTGHFIRNIFL